MKRYNKQSYPNVMSGLSIPIDPRIVEWVKGDAMLLEWSYDNYTSDVVGYRMDTDIDSLIVSVLEDVRVQIPSAQGKDLLQIATDHNLSVTRITINPDFINHSFGRPNIIVREPFNISPYVKRIFSETHEEKIETQSMFSVRVEDQCNRIIETVVVTAKNPEHARYKVSKMSKYRTYVVRMGEPVTLISKGDK